MRKKIISFVLAIVLAFSCIVPAFARGKWTHPKNISFEDYPQYLMDTQYDLAKVWQLEKSEAALKAFQNFKPDDMVTFFNGLSSMSSAIGMVNGVFSFLKMIGVIEDPMTKMLQSILESAQDIQKSVNKINEKMDKIQTTLNSEFAKIDYEFNQQRYTTYKAAWSDFFTTGAVKRLNELTDAYSSQINAEMISYAKKWQGTSQTGVRALYAEDATLLYAGDNMSGPGKALPEQPTYSYDKTQIKVKSAITLPAEYIVVDDDVKITADNYIEYIEKAFTDGVLKAADENKLIADDAFYTEWKTLSDGDKATKAARIADDLMSSLSYAVSHDIANATYLDQGTFASAFKSNYLNYCQTIQGANDVTSPITAALEKLTLTHAFEGEIKENFGDITAMLAMMTFQYGMTATFLTELDESMSRTEKDAVANDNQKTFNVICGSYDIFITGYDNYCYPLKTLVEYRDALLVSEVEAKDTGMSHVSIKSTIPWSVVDSSEYDVSNTAEEKQAAIDNMKGLLSLRDVSVLYYYQQNSGDADFMTYLENNGAINAKKADDAEFCTDIITSGYEVKDQKIDKNNSMKFHLFGYSQKGSPYSEFENNDFNLFPENENFKYYVHDQAVGDVFNVSAGSAGAGSVADVSGRTSVNTRLAARAVGDMGLRAFNMNTEFVFADGVYRKTANVPGYDTKSLGVDTSSAYENATYTVSTGYNYGALVVVPFPEEEVEETTASIFGNGNFALICGGAVLLCAAGFGGGFLVGKKKKNAVK